MTKLILSRFLPTFLALTAVTSTLVKAQEAAPSSVPVALAPEKSIELRAVKTPAEDAGSDASKAVFETDQGHPVAFFCFSAYLSMSLTMVTNQDPSSSLNAPLSMIALMRDPDDTCVAQLAELREKVSRHPVRVTFSKPTSTVYSEVSVK